MIRLQRFHGAEYSKMKPFNCYKNGRKEIQVTTVLHKNSLNKKKKEKPEEGRIVLKTVPRQKERSHIRHIVKTFSVLF